METFQQAQPADLAPRLTTNFLPRDMRSDPTEFLPASAAGKLVSLRQRAADLHAQIPDFDQLREAQLSVNAHQQRIKDLTAHRSEGGFGLAKDALQTVTEQRLLDRAKVELERLNALRETRTSRWSACGQLERAIVDWLHSVPGNCVLQVVEDAPLSELLVKADGGRIEAAVERYRLRLRELAADAHRVRSSPWPSATAKVRVREMLDRLADAGAPNFDAAIEHGADITFATKRLTSTVYNVPDAPAAVAYAEADAAIATMCWLWRDQMFSKICAGLDEISDDKNALDQRQREEMLATIATDELAISRAEAACIWHAEADGKIIDFRSDTLAEAAIGVELETRPRPTALPGTSPSLIVQFLEPR